MVGLLGACAGSHAPRDYDPPIPGLVAENEAAGDPYGGRFPYEEAIADLPGEGPLMAQLETDAGVIHCRLEPETAALTVATFVGLARGLRPFQEEEGGPWITAPYYDELVPERFRGMEGDARIGVRNPASLSLCRPSHGLRSRSWTCRWRS